MAKKRFFLMMRAFSLVLLYAGLIAYTLFQGDSASWFLTYFFSFILLFVIFASCYRLKNWHIDLAFSKVAYFDGDRIQAELILSRKSHYPLGYLFVRQMLPNSLAQNEVRKRIVYPFFSKKKFVYHLRLLKLNAACTFFRKRYSNQATRLA
ncbi:hypothetical protein MFLO_14112 [Listeria floridensis FSL S10-1187]|uniref:DUF58 domain-containing protein n=1 Tax=Listeria floridensis FSL S10-1187 TaxID=1265817 RepID=A0ABN0RC67_9LIST|nr:hypothetical protein [Listeria floridensis]EUJ26357.1 hypothetical protein MFLO_14112 [Listeria floridensis FSL S10-1187]